MATGNPWKIKDYQHIVSEFPITFIPQSELSVTEAEETGSTFVENAILKARNASNYSDFPTMAEDSGLIVDALRGAPGLYSARYAGKNAGQYDNIQKLLDEMEGFPKESRKAKLYVVAVLLRYPNDPAPLISEGVIHGEILEAPVGDNKFGYLPVFYLPEYGCTAGELSLAEKNKISHRGKAARELLSRYLAEGSE